MAIDLYRDDLGAVAGADLFAAIVDFTGVAGPPEDRAAEGYLLDFKQEWSDKAIKTVAAFANTFGGLLIIGVSEHNGRADQIVGIPVGPRQELKTSIASSIASNVSPTPAYQIWDIKMPSDPDRQLCIVRVLKGHAIHLWTRKDECPVYVRNGSESRRADAAQLQALLSLRSVPAVERERRATPIGNSFFVSRAMKEGAENQRMRSETFLQISVVPEQHLTIHFGLGNGRTAQIDRQRKLSPPTWTISQAQGDAIAALVSTNLFSQRCRL